MPFDKATQDALDYQGRRMNHALHVMVPPDRKEAELIQRRVDGILDRRPTLAGVTADGELVWTTASSWEIDQILPPAKSIAFNDTGVNEPVVPLAHEMPPGMTDSFGFDDPGGGVGVMDRP